MSFKFCILIEIDHERWNAYKYLIQHFPDHRIIDHTESIRTGHRVLADEIVGDLGFYIKVQIEKDVIILSTCDEVYTEPVRTIARICLSYMEFTGFFKLSEYCF